MVDHNAIILMKHIIDSETLDPIVDDILLAIDLWTYGTPETLHRIKRIVTRAPYLLTQKVDGSLPFFYAVALDAPLPVIEYLYEEYPQAIQEPNHHGELPLHCACLNNNVEIAKFLIEHYPEARTKPCKDGELPVHKLTDIAKIKKPSLELFDALLDGCEEAIFKTDPKRPEASLLRSFVGRCSDELCDALRRKILLHARRLKLKGRCQDFYRLVESVCLDRSMMALFLKEWPDFATLDLSRGRRPLHLVCSSKTAGYFSVPSQTIHDIIHDLVEANPKVLAQQDLQRETPVHCLVKSPACSASLLDLLLEKHSAFVSVRDKRDRTPFHAAVLAGADKEVVFKLLRASPTTLFASMVPPRVRKPRKQRRKERSHPRQDIKPRPRKPNAIDRRHHHLPPDPLLFVVTKSKPLTTDANSLMKKKKEPLSDRQLWLESNRDEEEWYSQKPPADSPDRRPPNRARDLMAAWLRSEITAEGLFR